ncbi:hypothetical protein [Streptomyces sp. WAC08241]|uniref:hypothetical protein n=1 Tax=Streptomyces sp. WAC08241 TaxID=2487421 RepID=UPI000F7B7AEE|nr:hypothetical protein [Streptomyces sp. WAC08241]RSS43840.1 hypothetical protein EF906_08820 [Streptomyces sp. WAC08241]
MAPSQEQLSRPFQLHLFAGGILHGVQFPSGHVAVEDTARDKVVTAMALGQLFADGYDGVVMWSEDVQRAERRKELEGLTDAELHARCAHPDWEYTLTEGPRKQWDYSDEPPYGDDGKPDTTWERNVDMGDRGWERFDYTEESYWRRLKQGKPQ